LELGHDHRWLRITTLERQVRADFHQPTIEHVGQDVTIKGWLYNLRSSGKILFPQLRDGTGWCNVSVEEFGSAGSLGRAQGLGQESALAISGTVREDSRAPGGYEIDLLHAEVFDEVHDYPIAPKEHGTEFLMDHRHLCCGRGDSMRSLRSATRW